MRYYFSPSQFVEVLPLPANAGTNRMDHIAFNTADAEGMRKYLASQKDRGARPVSKGADGSLWFQVKDPEGVTVEFVQPPARVPPGRRSIALFPHIIHVGAIIHDRALEDTFLSRRAGLSPLLVRRHEG